ncbi:glycosyltransferase family 4 protein [Nonomuraea aurantiaca]|uniref:glycosyltransferase family 4 protein n=1 Tax=Nonomuraea aurantiaca TaxID=2878562 RepID=UPI001CD9A2FB|nr:glycosyltransferase family 4 protein [Nonomuraea aurantiaca]MCA2222330.1 glycosyltransferase family 4 protein [Nonomuraea aurantiaca]
MRVAFVLGTTSGGTGRHVRMLVEGLIRRGHRVVVVGPGSVEEQFSFGEAGARFMEAPMSDRPHPVNDLRAVRAIRRVTKDADVVHAHGLRAGALAGLGLWGRSRRRTVVGGPSRGPVPSGVSRPVPGRFGMRTRVPLVVTLHNALTAGGLIGVVYGGLERVVARRADQVLVVSPDLGERMRALGAREVGPAVVPAPVPRAARRSPQEVRAELGAGRRPIVLTVARLAQQKGLETLLDAARGPWAGEGETPLFAVAGDGPLLGDLRRRIEAEALPVVLLGNRDDVPDLLAAATVVVWASRWEGQPLSLSETLMVGRPVIATAVGGVPDLLAGAGILVPYGDAAALRAAVQDVVGDGAEAARLAAAAARRGAELPDADEAVQSVLNVYGQSRHHE